jgi:hypothetical protein
MHKALNAKNGGSNPKPLKMAGNYLAPTVLAFIPVSDGL